MSFEDVYSSPRMQTCIEARQSSTGYQYAGHGQPVSFIGVALASAAGTVQTSIKGGNCQSWCGSYGCHDIPNADWPVSHDGARLSLPISFPVGMTGSTLESSTNPYNSMHKNTMSAQRIAFDDDKRSLLHSKIAVLKSKLQPASPAEPALQPHAQDNVPLNSSL